MIYLLIKGISPNIMAELLITLPPEIKSLIYSYPLSLQDIYSLLCTCHTTHDDVYYYAHSIISNNSIISNLQASYVSSFCNIRKISSNHPIIINSIDEIIIITQHPYLMNTCIYLDVADDRIYSMIQLFIETYLMNKNRKEYSFTF